MPKAKPAGTLYYASYGPIQIEALSLAAARRRVKVLAKRVKYDIPIVHRGDVVEVVRWKLQR